MAAKVVEAIQSLFGIAKKPTNPEEIKALQEKHKQKEERKRKNEICKRQEALLKKEIEQEWRVAMGNEIPKKKKDTFLLKDMTRRNVWMEPAFVFNQVKAQYPEEFFHPIENYVLKWQAPNSNFQSLIPLNDSFLQENAIIVMSHLLKKQQERIIFLFTTFDSAMSLFAPKVHPASLVSYHTKNEVLKKLSDYYLQGRVTTEEIQAILMCDLEVWKPALYNLLPADEQVFHTYLNEVKRDEKEEKPIHKSYLDGEISLKEYEDLKFPERKKRRDIEARDYPLPFDGLDCVICGAVKAGVINCHTCESMVCVRCIHTVFHGLDLPEAVEEGEEKVEETPNEMVTEENKEKEIKSLPLDNDESDKTLSYSSKKRQKSGKLNRPKTATMLTPQQLQHQRQNRQSFLLMHHKYCMKLGALPDVCPEIVGEAAFLREFRTRTKHAALAKLLPVKEEDFDDPNLYLEEDEYERELRLKEELRLQRERDAAEAELRRLAMENPRELQEKRHLFEDRKRRFEKLRKEILILNAKINDNSHTEQFIARNIRLRNEEIVKAENSVVKPLQNLLADLQKMELPGQFLPELIQDVEKLLEATEIVCSADVPPPIHHEDDHSVGGSSVGGGSKHRNPSITPSVDSRASKASKR